MSPDRTLVTTVDDRGLLVTRRVASGMLLARRFVWQIGNEPGGTPRRMWGYPSWMVGRGLVVAFGPLGDDAQLFVVDQATGATKEELPLPVSYRDFRWRLPLESSGFFVHRNLPRQNHRKDAVLVSLRGGDPPSRPLPPGDGWACSPERGEVAYLNSENQVVFLDLNKDLREVRRLEIPGEEKALFLRFLPDGEYLGVKFARSLSLYHVRDRRWLSERLPNIPTNNGIELSPRGGYLITGDPLPDAPDHFAVWDWRKGIETARIPFYPDEASEVPPGGNQKRPRIEGFARFGPPGGPTLVAMDGKLRVLAWDLDLPGEG